MVMLILTGNRNILISRGGSGQVGGDGEVMVVIWLSLRDMYIVYMAVI